MIARLKKLIPERSPIRLLWHRSKTLCAALMYGFPARKLTVVGVTGTDGKTTNVGMVAHILQQSGIKTGALSTAFFQIGEKVTWNETQKTSPSPFIVQKFLRTLLRNKCTHAVIEYSSHGLVQGRTLFTWPAIAAITNTSAEHLDYHGSMEQYRSDKGMLFQMLGEKGTKVLNRNDDTFSLYQAIKSEDTVDYAAGRPINATEHSLWLSDIATHPASSTATLHIGEKISVPLSLGIPGQFNLMNALCAIGCAIAAGVTPQQSASALATFKGVPGRMEPISEGQNFSVYIDFTVTPGAYEQTLSTLRSMIAPDKRILVLTGSCGDRMKEKRPVVGKICSELADVVVVANEDPYTEDPEKIIDEVWAGIDQTKTEAHRIFDRREAISYLLSHAQEGDAVLLCGKGSDTMMWVKEGQVPWNEREITREILHTLK